MNEQIKILDEETFKQINTNDKLRNAIAFAHTCLDSNNQFKHKKALIYPISFKVTDEQIKKAKELRETKGKQILKENLNNLLFIGMGMQFIPTIPDGIGNHRIRTTFLNSDGIKCFIEFGKGKENNIRIDHAIYNVQELSRDDKYNYKDLERNTPQLKYTYENILKVVNKNFNCNFKKATIDYYNLSPDEVICISPKVTQ